MATVALMVHHERQEAASLAHEAALWLLEEGHEVRLLESDARLAVLDEYVCEEARLCPGLDVAISLGGDGTMLRTIDLVADGGVPVIGVNLGQLGYLTEVEPPHLREALHQFLAGHYRIESRMRLAVRCVGPNGERMGPSVPALNEAVVEKTIAGHTVRMGLHIDDEFFTNYAADGLILATPTGSTAYAFSARGPIVAPTHAAILVTPVSPHMLFDRTLVLEPTTELRAEILGPGPAAVSVDGRPIGELDPGGSVVVTVAEIPARLVTFAPRNFLGILKAKFGLNDR